jgi:hypothetical protein
VWAPARSAIRRVAGGKERIDALVRAACAFCLQCSHGGVAERGAILRRARVPAPHPRDDASLGSCTIRRTITLNPALVQAPPSCIDYVLVHELVHLLEPGHTPRFYRLLARAMPDWRARQERLARAEIRWFG